MTKSIYALFFLGLITLSFSNYPNETNKNRKENDEIVWQSNYDDAVKLAKKKKKLLLVFFTGSDWCGPCKMLHVDLFENKEFIEFSSKNFILYKADFPRKVDVITPEQKLKNNELKNKFSIAGFPTIIIINSNDEVLGKQVGYGRSQSIDPHMNTFKSAIEKFKK
jgi:thioredoxin-related protein